jgi:hypothetical protein
MLYVIEALTTAKPITIASDSEPAVMLRTFMEADPAAACAFSK